jgi:hypothetical protein
LHDGGGWIIILDDHASLVYAVDAETGQVFWLEANDGDGEWYGLVYPEHLRDALAGMDIAEAIERGRLRVREAINGVPGCPELGGLIY